MEPTDQPPPTPQTWAETSAWAPTGEPETGAAAPAAWTPAPAALSQGPSPDDYVRPASLAPGRAERARSAASPTRWLVLAALVAEVVIVGLGDNQWMTKKVLHYTGVSPQPGFWHQFVYSTQSLAWRVSSAGGESNTLWISSLVRVAVVLALSAVLIALIVRRGSFWRAAVATLVAVVFSTQIAQMVAQTVYTGGREVGYQGVYTSGDTTGSGYGSTVTFTLNGSTGGGRLTSAIFGGPTGYRFVGGVLLGVLVGIVVGMVAKRLGEDEPQLRSFTPPSPQAPPQTFFPPGELQRDYEAGAPQAAPKLAEPGAFAPRPEGGRHSAE